MFCGIGLPEVIILLVVFGIAIICALFVSRILRKAGFSPWLSILSIIPVINLIFLWVFAFITWPGIDQKMQGRP